ncbi:MULTISPECIES: energy transducer TonB [unclassified Pseudoalteromonas]|uniref:energy transducer TonB n=1 Tax=unclassified Pseudoalteromonas TaxID=194690 RepID=UPI00055C82DD|nr:MULTISPECIES: energy transducer TonB [unclassified Pseudoalteromonas]MAY58746.1 energy transducer TonB [Pseudoalteromonas sp.]MDN3405958.1 energy transducer TonB [Pseudoalteromonas sp. APC 3218]MDN3408751.1 energy transducer TonB [Pseudoalteromonas sp. APC 3894]MDN3416156.1 energy transducer TonB [Pseudoalteromonas sp. APC 3227]MDN3419854.1 energy transducer TonB [Pseudoalteromonas sp. APC 3895]|tara:strand:+ start:59944 stop:60576 length:633 start_codon:yes stop_codon:yes gene_type:complete
MHTLEFPKNPMFKTSTAVLGGAVMTFIAFAFMQYLISGEQRAPIKLGDDITVEIFQAPEDKQTTHIKRIPPPPTPKVPPKTPPRVTPSNEPITAISTAPPIVINGFGNDMKQTLTRPTGDASPIVRINPKYPTSAARDGIEGWVQLSFNISPTGEVIDATVVNAEPKRIFDREALRAIKRWKYRPKVIEGVAQLQTGQTVQLDFKLDSSQ